MDSLPPARVEPCKVGMLTRLVSEALPATEAEVGRAQAIKARFSSPAASRRRCNLLTHLQQNTCEQSSLIGLQAMSLQTAQA